jgi:hypothetical protein
MLHTRLCFRSLTGACPAPCAPRCAPLRSICCSDPGYLVAEDYEKLMWEKLTAQNDAFKAERRAVLPP